MGKYNQQRSNIVNKQELAQKWDKLTQKKDLTKESKALEAVKQNGDALRYAPNPSEAVCLEAVKNYGYALQYAPKNIIDQWRNSSESCAHKIVEIEGQKYELKPIER